MKRTQKPAPKKTLKTQKSRESAIRETQNVSTRAPVQTTLESRIIRVFFSSPFRGLEMEREELAKKYWPWLSSLCSKAGYEFVPVDLRWGITSEKMSNASTIEVCLREIDRSDLFVGFYGQRYGWNGLKDEHLQRNFDVASCKYSWVKNYRDRSVTEIEFLHGFINKPGMKPACFFFREKAYDEKMAKSGNIDEACKYKDEPKAIELLRSLKTKIKTMKDKCCDFVEDYPDPKSGAQYMFEAIKRYLEKTILAKPTEEKSDIEKESLLHEAYYLSRLGVGTKRLYVGGEANLNEVERHVVSDLKGFSDKPLLVLGDAGFGKTALLANWIDRHKRKYPDDIMAYHFVGSAPNSTSEKDVLIRLVIQLTLGLDQTPNTTKTSKTKDTTTTKATASPLLAERSEQLLKLRTCETYDIYRKLTEVLKKISESGKRAIIVIDSLNRMGPVHQTKQELYWLPTELPNGVSLLVSTLTTDVARTKVWIEARHWETLEVKPLGSEQKHTIIKEMLAMRGKELTPTQAKQIVQKEQTSNALYLEIFLQELCNFGDFQKFNGHLVSLLEANSTKELFVKKIKQLEEDFNPPKLKENTVGKVLCCILLSRFGRSDQEIKEITGIPDQLWSSIFFAMEDFFVLRRGLYNFAYEDLADAVRDKYCKDEDIVRNYKMTMVNYYTKKLDEFGQHNFLVGKIVDRIADELPPLLKQLGKKEQLKDAVSNLSVFRALFSRPDALYDLINYLNFTHKYGRNISLMYVTSLDKHADVLRDTRKSDSDTFTVKDLLAMAYDIAEVVRESGHSGDAVGVLQWAIKLQKEMCGSEGIYKDSTLTDLYIGIIDKLAGLYCDLERFADSEELHKTCLWIKESLQESDQNRKSDIAISLNGLALVYQRLGKHDKAMEYYQKCLQIHREELSENHRLIGDTLNNIGSLLFGMDKFEEAINYLNSAVKVYEVCYFGIFHPDLAGSLNNLAICYRNLNQMDKAGSLLEKAYEMAVMAFGYRHPDVAERLINLGVYHQHLQQYDKALDMYDKALAICKESFGDSHLRTLLVMENIAGAYVTDGKHSQAHRFFKKAGEVLYQQGRMDASLTSLNDQMLQYYVNNDRKDDAVKLLDRLIDSSLAKPVYFITLEQLDTECKNYEQVQRPNNYTVEHAAERFPLDPDILEFIINVTSQCGNVGRMLHVLKAGQYDCGACNQAFSQFLQHGYRREGMKILEYAIEISPYEWMTYYNLAMVHAGYEEYIIAITLLRKAIVVEPEVLVLRETLGKLLMATGDADTAKSELQIALKLAKGDQQNVDKITDLLKKLG